MSKNKPKLIYVCQHCGSSYVKWQGRCSACGEWNSLVEEQERDKEQSIQSLQHALKSESLPTRLSDVDLAEEPRIVVPDQEFNRVLDGGLVPGSLVLLSGEPGIGKSTLLLQIALQLQSHVVLYISGEESMRQVKLRADRIPLEHQELYLLAETRLERIIELVLQMLPSVVIIDSIQTLAADAIESSPGSLLQIRECTARIMRVAKETQVSFILTGHINKEGQLAGPKLLEHMVDVVLSFEGDRNYSYRLLRSSKNRFGRTPELGIYEMRSSGLREVSNPSELFLSAGQSDFAGVAVAATLEGVRPLLIETQALVSQTNYGHPQRTANGLDLRRMSMLIAVLEKKLGFRMGDKDVFINLAGGIKMEDPALDLALACAMISAYFEMAIPQTVCFAAEVGLTGEVRPVSRIEQRIAEADKLGFQRIFIAGQQKLVDEAHWQIEVARHSDLPAVFQAVFGNIRP
jgi:DNA repair protein RadA/Sms